MRQRLVLSLAALGLCAGLIAAPEARQDVVRHAPEMLALALDAGADRLVMATAVAPTPAGAATEVTVWGLDPVRLLGRMTVHNRLADLRAAGGGVVLGAGERVVAPVGNARRLSAGGEVLRLDTAAEPPVLTSLFKGYLAEIDAPEAARGAADAAPEPRAAAARVPNWTSIALDGQGTVYALSLGSYSVDVLPDSEMNRSAVLPQLTLGCGFAQRLRLLPAGAPTHFVAATAEGAALELGRLAPDPQAKPIPNCFRVANVYAHKTEPTTINPIVHEVIAAPEGPAVVALDPNTGRLHVLPVDPAQDAILRAGSTEIELSRHDPGVMAAPGTYTLLAASADGAEILVSGRLLDHVLRFRRGARGLEPAGRFRAPGGQVRGLAIDGAVAAIDVQPAMDGSHASLHLVWNLADLPAGEIALSEDSPTVRAAQQRLTEAGLYAGPVDGIAGPLTAEAAAAALSGENEFNNDSAFENIIYGINYGQELNKLEPYVTERRARK